MYQVMPMLCIEVVCRNESLRSRGLRGGIRIPSYVSKEVSGRLSHNLYSYSFVFLKRILG